MKYTPLPKEMYQRNRAKFATKMAKNGVAIFNANDILPTNADGTMKFRQNNDLFYLCGIDQEFALTSDELNAIDFNGDAVDCGHARLRHAKTPS